MVIAHLSSLDLLSPDSLKEDFAKFIESVK